MLCIGSKSVSLTAVHIMVYKAKLTDWAWNMTEGGKALKAKIITGWVDVHYCSIYPMKTPLLYFIHHNYENIWYYCKQGNICLVLFSPLLPWRCQRANFKTGRIAMSQIISLQSQFCLSEFKMRQNCLYGKIGNNIFYTGRK